MLLDGSRAWPTEKLAEKIGLAAYLADPSCILVVVDFCGRLGNVLFQIAAVVSTALESGGTLCVVFPRLGTAQYEPNILRKVRGLIVNPSELEGLEKHHNVSRSLCWVSELQTAHGIYLARSKSVCGERRFNKFCGRRGRHCYRLGSSQHPRAHGDWSGLVADALLGSSWPRAPSKTKCPIVFLGGYFQDLRYFGKRLDWIRELFWDPPSALNALAHIEKSSLGRGSMPSALSIHFRLGDHLIWTQSELLHDDYHKNAVIAARERHGSDIWCFFFSDSADSLVVRRMAKTIPGCAQRVLLTGYTDVASLYMMSIMPMSVISASTFSFWAALLARKHVVIAPNMSLAIRTGTYRYLQQVAQWLRIPAYTAQSCRMVNGDPRCDESFEPEIKLDDMRIAEPYD